MNCILPTAYCPPIFYFVLLYQHKKATIELHETYPKQTWRNRCRIMAANGLLDLCIPITKPYGRKTTTGQALTSDHAPWQRLHWKSIVSAYQNAPYFLYYAPSIEPLYHNHDDRLLSSWNHRLLTIILSELGLKAEIKHSASYTKPDQQINDFRHIITPKQSHTGDKFDYKWPAYQQVFSDKHGFTGNLSVLDLLFNLGPDAIAYLHDCASSMPGQLMAGYATLT
jgi:hypothetical protein